MLRLMLAMWEASRLSAARSLKSRGRRSWKRFEMAIPRILIESSVERRILDGRRAWYLDSTTKKNILEKRQLLDLARFNSVGVVARGWRENQQTGDDLM